MIPNVPHSVIPGCPILKDIEKVQGFSKDLIRALRKLRRDLDDCQKCPNVDD